MRTPIKTQEFQPLFQSFKHEAFRLETLDQYLVVPEEREFKRFLNGEPLPEVQNKPWCDQIRNNISQGKRMRRVHVLTLPLTPYLRFEIDWGYIFSLAAGEEIFILNRNQLSDFSLIQDGDFWLFDDNILIRMLFDDTGKQLGRERDNDPEAISNCRAIRDRLLPLATPLRTFLRSERNRQD